MELVGTGATLTGGAMLLEEATKPKVAPGHDNVYATDNRTTLFKYKTLASEEEAVSTSEIIGYVILAICMVLFLTGYPQDKTDVQPQNQHIQDW